MYKILRKEVFSETVKLMVLEVPLVAPDPAQFSQGEKSDRFVVYIQRGGNTDPAGRRVNREVHIFDAFANHVYGQIIDRYLVHINTPVGC